MQRGFTLIELVMVIILLVIMAAVAIPRFSGYGGMKQGNAVLKIASDIRYAQNKATTTQQRSRVSFVVGGISYTINSCANYTSSTCTCAAWSLDQTIDLSSDYSGVTISGVVIGNCIEFDSLGRPYYNTGCANGGASCNTSLGATVAVSCSGEPDRNIVVQSQTGMVSY